MSIIKMKHGAEKKESFVRREMGILNQQLGYKREFPDPNHIRITIPTLPYEGLDYTGKKLVPWSLLKLFDSCELSDFWPLRENDSDPGDIRVFYLLNLEVKIDYSFYLLESPKFTLIIDNSVKFLKRSSRCIESVLLHPSLKKPYAVMSAIDVNMDPVLRVPKPFPAWWKEHFKFPDQGERREFRLPPKPLVGVFSSRHRVEFSDTDENKHTNYTVYIRMAFNSMCEFMLAGKYGKDLDVYEIGLKTLQCTYKNECGLGDILTVSSWACQDSKDTFYFEIHNDGTECVTMSMCFYNMSDERTLVSNL